MTYQEHMVERWLFDQPGPDQPGVQRIVEAAARHELLEQVGRRRLLDSAVGRWETVLGLDPARLGGDPEPVVNLRYRLRAVSVPPPMNVFMAPVGTEPGGAGWVPVGWSVGFTSL